MYATCCPAYTIRLEATRFKISKKQRQVVRRVERFLECGSVLQCDEVPKTSAAQNTSNVAVTTCVSESPSGVSSENGAAIKYSAVDPKHILTVETVKAESTPERYQLYKKYQIAVHGDAPSKITPTGFKRFLVDSPLFNSSSDISESSDQRGSVKNGDVSVSESRNNSDAWEINQKNVPKKWQYGTYHQLHRLDGRLVAVGVVDILPSGLSSVYLFYDPDEKLLSLGTYVYVYVYV
jgi:arginyl-tRNA---protein transferase